MGGLLSLCREAKFLIIIPYVFEMKSPLGTQIFNLIQRRLDAKFENSKLDSALLNFTEICIVFHSL